MLSVKINDQKRTFCWGTLAFSLTCDELDVTFADLLTGLNEDKYWMKFCYNALVAYEKTFENSDNLIGDEIIGLSYYQYVYWIDHEAEEGTNLAISESFGKSKYKGKELMRWIEDFYEKATETFPEDSKTPTKKKKQRLPK